MDLMEELAAMLGLGEDATPEQLLEGLKTALAESKTTKEPPAAPPAEAVMANKAEPTAMEVELMALKANLADRDAEAAVDMALKAGKLSPAMRAWGKAYALKDPAGFGEYVKTAPQAVPLGQLDYTTTALKEEAPAEATLMVCKMLGLSADDLKKNGKGC